MNKQQKRESDLANVKDIGEMPKFEPRYESVPGMTKDDIVSKIPKDMKPIFDYMNIASQENRWYAEKLRDVSRSVVTISEVMQEWCNERNEIKNAPLKILGKLAGGTLKLLGVLALAMILAKLKVPLFDHLISL